MNDYSKAATVSRSTLTDWAGLSAVQFDAIEFTPATVATESQSDAADLGHLQLARLTCSGTQMEWSAQPSGRVAPPTYILLLLTHGEGEISHYGVTTTLAQGDFVLCDSTAPIKLGFKEPVEAVFIRVAATRLKEHLPSPEYFCGRALRADDGLTATASAMAISLFGRLEAGLQPTYQDRVARHLLDILAMAYALAFDTPLSRSSIVSGRCATVKLFIEQHLRDPDLSPCSIAARMKLSPRYLRMIFASEKETVSAYILRRRLEQCARQIADPVWQGHSMTKIAFGWGFNSAPHFTRTFRDRFDMPPREYRRLKLTGESRSLPRTGPARLISPSEVLAA